MNTEQSFAGDPVRPRRLVMIADLAEQLGVTARALRHYEDIGLIRSERTARNVRVYDLETVEILKVITRLRQVDVPITVIAEVVKQGSDPAALALAMVQALNAALIDRKRAVARIAGLLEALETEARPAAPATPVERPRSGRFMRSEASVSANGEAG